MEIISSQPYIKVSREIKYNEQHYIETQHLLYLYEDKIITASKQFPLKDVFDISYRSLSKSYGFLYLHTNQGVLSYTVRTNPRQFIKAYKKLR
jgi:hypothetical protein